jgi:tetratricopeptide (TPR) repeat protein
MITAMLVGLLQLAAPSSPPAPVDEVGGGDVIFTRVEPHLAAGARALAANDPELALERYRRAETSTDEQRAVVEYNAGQALLLQAMTAAAAQPASPGAEPAAPPPPPDVGDALSSFERAASLGKTPAFVSEARLAAGNAALVGNKLDDAIAQLRKALVGDPRNERARHNLQRALELKQQQPPQENKGDGDKNDEQKSDKDDKSDEQKSDKGDQKSDEQKPDEQKPDGAPGEPKPTPKKPTSREEARRLLEGVRSREKPLSPIEMRGAERRPAENGKDW